jgi:hypothetical protein
LVSLREIKPSLPWPRSLFAGLRCFVKLCALFLSSDSDNWLRAPSSGVFFLYLFLCQLECGVFGLLMSRNTQKSKLKALPKTSKTRGAKKNTPTYTCACAEPIQKAPIQLVTKKLNYFLLHFRRFFASRSKADRKPPPAC